MKKSSKIFGKEYFDLNREYSKVKTILSEDKLLKKAIDYGYGIRILKTRTFWNNNFIYYFC